MGRPCLSNSPKFKSTSRRLGIPRPHFRGHLEFLWDAANECGNPVIGTPEDIEATAEWAGDPGALFVALRDGRWLDQTEDGLWEIHDFWVHCPDYVRKRAEREAVREQKGHTLSGIRREAARRRWHRNGQPPTDASDMQTDASENHLHPVASESSPTDANECNWKTLASCQDANVRTPAPAPAPLDTDRMSVSCSEPSETASEPPASKVVMRFPTTGKGPKEWSLTAEKLAEYVEAFPALDVRGEIRRALQWILDNPTRKKTAKGMPAYLTRWLGKAQNQGQGRNQQAPPTQETEEQIAARVRSERADRQAKYGPRPAVNHDTTRNGDV
jgi:hypothetical protein